MPQLLELLLRALRDVLEQCHCQLKQPLVNGLSADAFGCSLRRPGGCLLLLPPVASRVGEEVTEFVKCVQLLTCANKAQSRAALVVNAEG